jgi:hypothetical protein
MHPIVPLALDEPPPEGIGTSRPARQQAARLLCVRSNGGITDSPEQTLELAADTCTQHQECRNDRRPLKSPMNSGPAEDRRAVSRSRALETAPGDF